MQWGKMLWYPQARMLYVFIVYCPAMPSIQKWHKPWTASHNVFHLLGWFTQDFDSSFGEVDATTLMSDGEIEDEMHINVDTDIQWF